MTLLDAFGAISVAMMLGGYVLERRSHWFTLTFATGSAVTSVYAFAARAWPVGIVAFALYLIGMNRWVSRADAEGV